MCLDDTIDGFVAFAAVAVVQDSKLSLLSSACTFQKPMQARVIKQIHTLCIGFCYSFGSFVIVLVLDRIFLGRHGCHFSKLCAVIQHECLDCLGVSNTHNEPFDF